MNFRPAPSSQSKFIPLVVSVCLLVLAALVVTPAQSTQAGASAITHTNDEITATDVSGDLDPTFDGDGQAITDMGGGDKANAIAQQKQILEAHSVSVFAAFRMHHIVYRRC